MKTTLCRFTISAVAMTSLMFLACQPGPSKEDFDNVKQTAAHWENKYKVTEEELEGVISENADGKREIERLKLEIKELTRKLEDANAYIDECERKMGQRKPVYVEPHEPRDTPPPGEVDKRLLPELRKAVAFSNRLERYLTIVGGPLNKYAVTELELDETKVAKINALLKDEAERIRMGFIPVAAARLKNRTVDELQGMPLDKILFDLVSLIIVDSRTIMNLGTADKIARLNREKSRLEFLSKNSISAAMGKVCFIERQKLYTELGSAVTAEELKALKEKYITPGGFKLPGGVDLTLGKVTSEMFE